MYISRSSVYVWKGAHKSNLCIADSRYDTDAGSNILETVFGTSHSEVPTEPERPAVPRWAPYCFDISSRAPTVAMAIASTRAHIGICNGVVLTRMTLFSVNIIMIGKDDKKLACSTKINSQKAHIPCWRYWQIWPHKFTIVGGVKIVEKEA